MKKLYQKPLSFYIYMTSDDIINSSADIGDPYEDDKFEPLT